MFFELIVAGIALFALAKSRDKEPAPKTAGLPGVLSQEPDEQRTRDEAMAVLQAAAQAAVAAAATVAAKTAMGDTAGAKLACAQALDAARDARTAADVLAGTADGAQAVGLYEDALAALTAACERVGAPAPSPLEFPAPSSQPAPKAPDPIVLKSPGLPQQIVIPSAIPDFSPPGSTAPPLPSAIPLPALETTKQLDPNGTIALAHLLLAREQSSGWKSAHQAEVKTWQPKHNLTPDGKFGRLSALAMAQEVGVLPLVRYWPTSSGKAAILGKYRGELNAMADALNREGNPDRQAHATALRLSALREDGRSYGVADPKPVSQQSVEDMMGQILKGGVA